MPTTILPVHFRFKGLLCNIPLLYMRTKKKHLNHRVSSYIINMCLSACSVCCIYTKYRASAIHAIDFLCAVSYIATSISRKRKTQPQHSIIITSVRSQYMYIERLSASHYATRARNILSNARVYTHIV